MDVDEQLDDELEAAFEEAFEEAPATADDGAGAGDAGDAGEAAGAGPGLDEDDYDDTDAPARGEPATKPDDDSTLQSRPVAPGSVRQQCGTRAMHAYPRRCFVGLAVFSIVANWWVFDSLTEQQKSRFEAFMRSSIPKPKMKKLMTAILRNAVPNERAIIAMCGISKLFLGELVEMARVCASQEGHTGPLLPRHVHRAYQQLGGLAATANTDANPDCTHAAT
eukprot:XP_001689422.1 predicted protein [Chlamydomonas reinhardtii]